MPRKGSIFLDRNVRNFSKQSFTIYAFLIKVDEARVRNRTVRVRDYRDTTVFVSERT